MYALFHCLLIINCVFVLACCQDKQEKEFIYHHSRTVFELLDQDGSGNISAEEFETFGFVFNFQVKFYIL